MLETFRKVWLGFISEMLARGIAESVLLSSFIPANRWKWVVSPPPPKKKVHMPRGRCIGVLVAPSLMPATSINEQLLVAGNGSSRLSSPQPTAVGDFYTSACGPSLLISPCRKELQSLGAEALLLLPWSQAGRPSPTLHSNS